jgi:hypothetical protein
MNTRTIIFNIQICIIQCCMVILVIGISFHLKYLKIYKNKCLFIKYLFS